MFFHLKAEIPKMHKWQSKMSINLCLFFSTISNGELYTHTHTQSHEWFCVESVSILVKKYMMVWNGIVTEVVAVEKVR